MFNDDLNCVWQNWTIFVPNISTEYLYLNPFPCDDSFDYRLQGTSCCYILIEIKTFIIPIWIRVFDLMGLNGVSCVLHFKWHRPK